MDILIVTSRPEHWAPVLPVMEGRGASVRQAGSLEQGMETFDQCLFRMVKEGLIELEAALNAADSRDGLALKFRLSEGADAEHDPYADYDAPAGAGGIKFGSGF